jgi:hypothetical protein
MKNSWQKLLLLLSLSILFISQFTNYVHAGEAGVGVLNVSPQYSMIRLVQQDDYIRVYLTVSDYNSWEDIYSVSITLEDAGVKKAEFLYKQYSTVNSYIKVNEFSELPQDNNLLVPQKCSHNHSNRMETVEERCNLEVLFVFYTTWFTRLNVLAQDRGGSTATMQLDYSTEDLIRSGTIIIIPGFDDSIILNIPPYLLDLIALVIATIGTWYVIKKTNIRKKMRAVYEKG